MSSMRVARLHGPGDVRQTEEEIPRPAGAEQLVEVTSVGICGSDLHWFSEGGIGDAVVSRPLVLGHEMAGVVRGGPDDGTRVAIDPAIPCEECEVCKAGHPNLCPDVVFAGALFPVQPARPTGRGFVVDGRWKFASGCMAADIVCVGIPGDDTTSGKPRGALVRPERLEIVQDWDVVGMQGTGSFDLVAHDVEVGREWTFIRGGEPVIDEPLYRYPAITYAAQVLSVVSAGVARAALDFAEDVGSGRASITGAPKLADRPYYRAGIAEAEATLRSARAYFYEAADEAWQALVDGGVVSDEQNAHLRLSAAHLARTCAQVVHQVVSLSGTAAIYRNHPLPALLGDALVPQEHAFLSPAVYDAAGAVLMGQPPTMPAFR